MKCENCGKETSDGELQYRSVGDGSRYRGSKFVSYWICHDCAKSRQETFRVLYWIVGVALALGAIGVAIDALF